MVAPAGLPRLLRRAGAHPEVLALTACGGTRPAGDGCADRSMLPVVTTLLPVTLFTRADADHPTLANALPLHPLPCGILHLRGDAPASPRQNCRPAATPLPYSLAIVIATGLLHLLGHGFHAGALP